MKLRRDAHEELHAERVVVRLEGLGRSARDERVQHRRLDLEEVARVEVVADELHQLRALLEGLANAGVAEQVDVTAAVPLFGVVERLRLGPRLVDRVRERLHGGRVVLHRLALGGDGVGACLLATFMRRRVHHQHHRGSRVLHAGGLIRGEHGLVVTAELAGERTQGLAEELERGGSKGQLAGLRLEERAGDADEVGEIDQLPDLERVLAEHVLLDVDLQASAAFLNRDEGRLAEVAHRNHPAGERERTGLFSLEHGRVDRAELRVQVTRQRVRGEAVAVRVDAELGQQLRLGLALVVQLLLCADFVGGDRGRCGGALGCLVTHELAHTTLRAAHARESWV